MSELVEVLFPSLTLIQCQKLFQHLAKHEQGELAAAISYFDDEREREEFSATSYRSVMEILEHNTNCIVEIKLPNAMKKLVPDGVTLMCEAVERKIDFRLLLFVASFQDSPGGPEFAESLFAICQDLAERIGTSKYCAGLEPAEDEKTRFFSDGIRGPMMKS